LDLTQREETTPIPIIGFDDNAWVGAWMNRQELLSRLAARGWPTIYSNSPLSIWERNRPRWEMSGFRSKFVEIDGVTVDYPGRLTPRWPNRNSWDQMMMQHHARRLRKVTGEKFVLWLFNPRHYEQVSYLQPSAVLFHVRDYFPGMGVWTSEEQYNLDALAERADLITIAGEAMGECIPVSARGKVRLLENGVDAPAYIAGCEEVCPADLAGIPSPRIGLVGSINSKIDLSSILKLSKIRNDLQFVFIGPVMLANGHGDDKLQNVWDECLQQPNIHWLGLKKHHELPAYLAYMDANMMAYRTSEIEESWVRFINPLKMYAYLAAGKPIIGVDIREIARFADFIEIARGPDGWEAAIDNAISVDSKGTASDRQAVALRNTWDSRVDEIEGWILEILSAGKTE
jgi:hypothetical protein